MAPIATTTEPEPETQTTAPLPTNDTNGNGHSVTNNGNNGSNKTSYIKPPIAPTGILEKRFRYEDTTPVIGREIFDVNIVDDILGKDGEDTKEEGEELLRDLAVTSEFILFFRSLSLGFLCLFLFLFVDVLCEGEIGLVAWEEPQRRLLRKQKQG